jgi:DEAD/DEAH box helicase domain-containing protein
MGMSVGIVWDNRTDEYSTYLEKDVEDLIAHLQRADLVVGFNIIGFDYTVLKGYNSKFDFNQLNTLDILREIHQQLKYRVSLDSLARETLDSPKSADGLQALKWWKQGRIDLISEYCKKDVEVTRRLFEFALEKDYLLFDRKGEGRMRIPLAWDLDEWVARGQQDET